MSRKFIFVGSYLSYVYLVDLFSPIELFSLLKENSTSTLCIRVRRSSDNTEQDIGFVGNSLDTTSLLSFVGVGSGFITKWYNQGVGGATYDKSQTSLANQPRIVNAGVLEVLNTLPAIEFVNPSAWFLESTVSESSENNEVFSVFSKTANLTATAAWSFYGAASNQYRHLGTGVSAAHIGAIVRNTTTYVVESAATLNVQYLVSASYTATERQLYRNNTYIGNSINTSNAFTSTKHYIGRTTAAGGTASKHIQFVARFSTIQTANRAVINALINSRYGIY